MLLAMRFYVRNRLLPAFPSTPNATSKPTTLSDPRSMLLWLSIPVPALHRRNGWLRRLSVISMRTYLPPNLVFPTSTLLLELMLMLKQVDIILPWFLTVVSRRA